VSVPEAHRAVDAVWRLQRNVDLLGHELGSQQQAAIFGSSTDLDAVGDDDFVPDDVLRLMFVACHPVLSAEARVALTLRLIGGRAGAGRPWARGCGAQQPQRRAEVVLPADGEHLAAGRGFGCPPPRHFSCARGIHARGAAGQSL
jgi:hypothetical protein